MTNFIKTNTGAWVAVSSIDYAEPFDDKLIQVSTSRGRHLVSKTDFNKIAGITAPAKKTGKSQ